LRVGASGCGLTRGSSGPLRRSRDGSTDDRYRYPRRLLRPDLAKGARVVVWDVVDSLAVCRNDAAAGGVAAAIRRPSDLPARLATNTMKRG
jgi:hypothetical protein